MNNQNSITKPLTRLQIERLPPRTIPGRASFTFRLESQTVLPWYTKDLDREVLIKKGKMI